MDIEDFKRIVRKLNTETIQSRLEQTLQDIKFLQSIYETGGELSYFSKEFRDAAYRERQELCQLSSACYSVLKEREKA